MSKLKKKKILTFFCPFIRAHLWASWFSSFTSVLLLTHPSPLDVGPEGEFEPNTVQGLASQKQNF